MQRYWGSANCTSHQAQEHQSCSQRMQIHGKACTRVMLGESPVALGPESIWKDKSSVKARDDLVFVAVQSLLALITVQYIYFSPCWPIDTHQVDCIPFTMAMGALNLSRTCKAASLDCANVVAILDNSLIVQNSKLFLTTQMYRGSDRHDRSCSSNHTFVVLSRRRSIVA